MEMTEVARLLALRPPFSELAATDLGELALEAELEFHAAGAPILTEDGGPVTFLRVIHSGAVDVVHAGRLLDLLGPGDTFGHDAMLAGLPPGFEARAAEDTLCYRIPVAVARPLLDRAREGELRASAADPSRRAVVTLIRTATVRCAATESVGAVAQRMTEAAASAAIVELADGDFGIVTDRDLRSRVLAAGRDGSVRVAEVMTAPAITAPPDRLGAEVLFELLERGIHHMPVVTASGRLVGVVEDSDLLAVRQRAWFGARRAIGRAHDQRALADAAAALPGLLAELHAAELPAGEISRVHSALLDALVVRALQLAADRAAVPEAGLVWLALGPHARRELTPAGAPLGAAVCAASLPPAFLGALTELFTAVGLPPPPPPRSAADWLDDCLHQGLARSLLFDRRVLFGTPLQPLPLPEGPLLDAVLAQLLAAAREPRAPTGFASESVVAHDGVLTGRLDLHATALEPLAAIALWASVAAGRPGGSTPERLQAAADAGVIGAAQAGELAEAFTVALGLVEAIEVARLAASAPATTEAPDPGSGRGLDAAELSPFARNELRHVFRTIAAAQRGL
jgi:CBS domain-containing protein